MKTSTLGRKKRIENDGLLRNMLSQGILNMLVAIQRSKEVFPELAGKRDEFVQMDTEKKNDTAEDVADKVVSSYRQMESSSRKPPAPSWVKSKLIEELRKL